MGTLNGEYRLMYDFTDVQQNKKRDQMERDLGMSADEAKHQGRINAECDMTDVENIHFRYNM
jgi:MFS transporter, ACS family, allantoate permease